MVKLTWSNVRAFAGAVLLPTYERGDCHTIAETAGAVEHYIETRAKRTPIARDPKACLELGLYYMQNATREALQDAMSGAYETIMANTQHITALKNIDFEVGLAIIYNEAEPALIKSLADRLLLAINRSSDDKDEKMNKVLRLEDALKATPLYIAIDAMKRHVENLGEPHASHISPILKKLKDNAVLYVNPKSTASEKVLARNNFQTLLEHDLSRATTNRSWKFILLNILIAATGIGLIPLAITYAKQGICSLQI